jgi:hypothetical protein
LRSNTNLSHMSKEFLHEPCQFKTRLQDPCFLDTTNQHDQLGLTQPRIGQFDPKISQVSDGCYDW